MHISFQFQKIQDLWALVINFDRDAPKSLEEAEAYADDRHLGGDDKGNHHVVLLREGKLVQLQLRNILSLLPEMDPEDPEHTLGKVDAERFLFPNSPHPALAIHLTGELAQTTTANLLGPYLMMKYEDGKRLTLLIPGMDEALKP